jgi:hypothetical protein
MGEQYRGDRMVAARSMRILSAVMPSPEQLHRKLALFNQQRLRPALPHARWREEISAELEPRLLEGDVVETALAEVAAGDPAAFLRWFEDLRNTGPGQGDRLFPWLAERASLQEMRWFLAQEVAGEAGFDDLVALTQLKLPVRPKLELARNYWDEMGRGHEHAMHGPMLGRLAQALDVTAPIESTVWEALALANLLVALAMNRRYAFHSIGALGAIEMTAPGRVGLVDRGLERLGVTKDARVYFALHATIDLQHSEAWNREVIAPLVEGNPAAARAIAEGALLRLRAGARCFDRYRAQFGL